MEQERCLVSLFIEPNNGNGGSGGLGKKIIRPNRKNILMYMKKEFYLFGS